MCLGPQAAVSCQDQKPSGQMIVSAEIPLHLPQQLLGSYVADHGIGEDCNSTHYNYMRTSLNLHE